MKVVALLAFLSGTAFAQGVPTAPPVDHPNRVVLWGGYGPDGVQVVSDGSHKSIRPYNGPLLGISYAHTLWDRTSLNAMLIRGADPASPTYVWMAGAGWDF